jgi:hypothetical protein
MGKILKYEEIKKNEHVLYSESYEVKFWFQKPDGFWEQRYEMYYGKNKGEHEYVVNRWLSDYNDQLVRYVSVTYQ